MLAVLSAFPRFPFFLRGDDLHAEISQPFCYLWFLLGETSFQIHAFEGKGCKPALHRATTASSGGKDAPSLSAQSVAGEDTTQVKNTVLLLLLNFINRKMPFIVFKEFLVKEL